MRANPKPYEVYKHFKGNLYQILNIAKDSEDGHQIVIYQAMYGTFEIYARDLAQFMSPVDKEKYPQVTAEYRFTKVETTSVENTANTAVDVPVVSTVSAVADGPATKSFIAESTSAIQAVPASQETSSAYQLDPQVEAFLDADTYTEKLNILAGLRKRITSEMLQIMAVTMDIELNEGSVEEKYQELTNCLLTKEKFEAERRG